jgi:plastocyanin
MKTHKITVRVGNDGIQVDPDTLVMTAADEVQWADAGSRRFTVEFEGNGPFKARRLDYASATATQRPNARGRFKYSILSEGNPSLRLDPVIVVEDPPTGVTG